jgi:hypothetical protein
VYRSNSEVLEERSDQRPFTPFSSIVAYITTTTANPVNTNNTSNTEEEEEEEGKEELEEELNGVACLLVDADAVSDDSQRSVLERARTRHHLTLRRRPRTRAHTQLVINCTYSK